ncbi:unnamed protein product [Urochloa decumbens]|uniref:DUF4220 domain-containing protein n=1 Tax=Urochloa decumbens TaxID=240449 RepID=A0ABC9B5V3_9POAL
MFDIWSIVRWWDDWQLRVLVLGSLGLQWFLLLAAPMRKYTMPHVFRTCIWLAYISSDALAIYALATLFNRHARTVPASNCAPSKEHQSRILEVLWAPILLIHLGGQEELTAYEIEDNELWTRHTVTLVTQVAVASYAFYKSWPSDSDGKLTVAAVLLFIIGIVSFSEKPLALNRAKIKRLAAVSAWIQGTKKPSFWRERLNQFFLFEESNCFTGVGLPRLLTTGGKEEGGKKKPVALSEADKVLMVLSDMSLRAAAKDLVERNKAKAVEEVLPPLPIAERSLPRWLRGAFAFIYTRATVVVTPVYLVYHLLLVPVLHIAALTLFATSDKHEYKRADVKITYIVLCLTAALDFLAVFFRQLVYRLMSMTEVPPLCETVPGYNLIDEALREADKGTGWMYTCARQLGLSCKGEYFGCRPRRHGELYKKVVGAVLPDLVSAQNRDLASYRIFHSTAQNWALSKQLQEECGVEVKKSLEDVSFDRSVLLWHIATDLCFRCTDNVVIDGDEEEQAAAAEEEDEAAAAAAEGGDIEGDGSIPDSQGKRYQTLRFHMECTEAISNYMAHLLNFNPDMLLTGSRHHLITEARDEIKSCFLSVMVKGSGGCNCNSSCTGGNGCSCSCSCSELNQGHLKLDQSKLKQLISNIAKGKVINPPNTRVFHIIAACKLAEELLGMTDDTRRTLMYQVWLGMLCYSASMCRGYLHAKSLGEGGEFLSFVWLLLSLKGAKSLADKLQMPPALETQPSFNN